LTFPDPSSTVHEWVRDANGRVTEIKVGGVTVSESAYRPGGWLLWTRLRNSSGAEIATTWHDYDALGRHTRAVTWRASDGLTLSDLRWEYDVLDRVEKIHYFHLGVVTTIGYNRRSEVISEVTTQNAVPPYTNQYGSAPTGNESAPSVQAVGIPGGVLSVPGRSATYVYDKGGNRTSQTIDGVTTTLTYDAASRLTGESRSGWSMAHVYDGRGNETERTTTAGGTVTVETFGYNYLNLMSTYVKTVNSSVTAQWQYDYWPTGERYAKTNLGTNAGQLYATHGDNVVAEYNKSSGGAITLLNTYGQGLGLDHKSLRMPASGGRIHYLGDMVGTINVTLEDDGDKAEECVRDVWGVSFAGDTNDERYGFAQREHDTESSLVYMRHRMYDPRLGRFTQSDPITANHAFAHYIYASNCPNLRRDPLGLQDEPTFDKVITQMFETLQRLRERYSSTTDSTRRQDYHDLYDRVYADLLQAIDTAAPYTKCAPYIERLSRTPLSVGGSQPSEENEKTLQMEFRRRGAVLGTVDEVGFIAGLMGTAGQTLIEEVAIAKGSKLFLRILGRLFEIGRGGKNFSRAVAKSVDDVLGGGDCHLLTRHGRNVNPATLIRRIEQEGATTASAFTTDMKALKTAEKVLRDNEQAIRKWLKSAPVGDGRDFYLAAGSRTENLGYGFTRGANGTAARIPGELKNALLTIEADGKGGFKIITGYPIQ
jgi:RHS repeat-associated protein